MQSLQALRRFNALGYGRDGSGLVLNLVTNPVGAFLPAAQASLEREWKRELKRRYGIEFNRLFTITNMPISRYLEWLEHSGNLESVHDQTGERVQSRGRRWPDVPLHDQRRLGRPPVRLRFQSDAGSRGGDRSAANQ